MEFYRKLKKSRLPWYLFYGGLTIELLIVIVDKSNLINPFEGRLFQITFLIFLLKELKNKVDLRWVGFFCLFVWLVGWLVLIF